MPHNITLLCGFNMQFYDYSHYAIWSEKYGDCKSGCQCKICDVPKNVRQEMIRENEKGLRK